MKHLNVASICKKHFSIFDLLLAKKCILGVEYESSLKAINQSNLEDRNRLLMDK